MRRTLIPAALLACAGLVQAAGTSALQRVFDDAVKAGFAGEVLVGGLDAVHFEAVAGVADREQRLPHRSGQVWRWASVSKQVTAALVMRQVDAGRLQLDDTVAQHLPGFAGPSAALVTVRQLLQHLSGLPNPDDSAPGSAGVPGFYTAEQPDALAYCAGTPKRPPGTAFEYNNCDTLVLAALLARVAGQPFETLLQTQLIKPLGLQSLGLAGTAAPRASAVAYSANGRAVPQPRLANFGAAGALEGSARDLLEFDRALLRFKLVSEASSRTMWAGEPKWGYVALGAWGYPATLAGCARPVQLVERRGDVGGSQVRNILAPALGKAVIVFTNAADFEFGEVWQGRGFSHALLSAALCPLASSH